MQRKSPELARFWRQVDDISPRSSLFVPNPVLNDYNVYIPTNNTTYNHYAPPIHHPNPQARFPHRPLPNKPNHHHDRQQNGRRRHRSPQVGRYSSKVIDLLTAVLSSGITLLTRYCPNASTKLTRYRCHSDAFSKREQADENLYVHQKEQEKLQQLKQKIADHKQHLEELDKHVYASYKSKKRETEIY